MNPMTKQPRVVCKKYTDAACGNACVRCHVDDKTVVACHYSGRWSGALGNGMGKKCDDLFTADLCGRCHSGFDLHQDGFTSEDFMFCILVTQRRRLHAGLIRLG